MPQPTHQALYRACMKEAAAQGRSLMQRMLRRAAFEMPRIAEASRDVVERNLLAEAARLLVHHQGLLFEAFPQALLQEFAHALAGDHRKAGGGVSFDTLEMMADDQVQESVEVVRTQQVVQAAVARQLDELNALMCVVQGHGTVQPHRNPLRPEVYVRALRSVTRQSPVPPSARRRWMLHLGEALGVELAGCYSELCALLRTQGVMPGNVAAAPSAAAGAGADPNTLLNVRELRRLLAGEFDPATPPPGAAAHIPQADFNLTMPAAFEALQEMRQVDQVMQRLRQRQAAQPQADGGVASLREGLRNEARTAGQQLGFEVVTLMVDNIAADARLLPPVQAAVRKLEPALLRLALVDPRFFSDKNHPARRLLQEMTQRSLAWTSVDAPGFREFVEPLLEAVGALLDARAGAEPFEIALNSLNEVWGDSKGSDSGHRERAVRALLRAEQRNLVAERIVQQMRQRTDVAHAPLFVRQFVTGPWAQVIAQARLGDASGEQDPEGYVALVGDLALAATNRTRAARMLPAIAAKVRQGLTTIGFPAAQAEQFLAQLADVPGLQEAEAAQREETGVETWLAPAEAQQSNFLALQSVPQALGAVTQPGFIDTAPGAAETALTEHGLLPGAWVDMFIGGAWGRWQLTWTSPHNTLFMFTHSSGRSQSMARRLVQKMLIAGALKLVSAQGVVDGALDAVADKALRNSL
ncbi:DUF1631 family protein [Ramlibacter albus]|uniref:DUF1631 family protein n=1 Tax=Ramlibacter albus TaxID=2079448 RepID=A0A923S2X5_9BURK|nr:DUF1631 family protein [Ramlibacter albus]MBC5765934.1 DUF1631 family protein [Ramlibacter albus]